MKVILLSSLDINYLFRKPFQPQPCVRGDAVHAHRDPLPHCGCVRSFNACFKASKQYLFIFLDFRREGVHLQLRKVSFLPTASSLYVATSQGEASESCIFKGVIMLITIDFRRGIYQDPIIRTLGLVRYERFINHTCVLS